MTDDTEIHNTDNNGQPTVKLNIQKLREKLKLTREEIADAMGGLTYSAIYQLETGKIGLSVRMARLYIALANSYGIVTGFDYLFEDQN